MALTPDQRAEIEEYAERFVGAFVKPGGNSRYTVSGQASGSIDHAVELAMKLCGRPKIDRHLAAEQEEALRACLAQEIKKIASD